MACDKTIQLSKIDSNGDHRLQLNEYLSSTIKMMNTEALRVRAGEKNIVEFRENFGNLSIHDVQDNYELMNLQQQHYFSGGFDKVDAKSAVAITTEGKRLSKQLSNIQPSLTDSFYAKATLIARRISDAAGCYR